jgi:16S rRNA G1207 methylase RsmC
VLTPGGRLRFVANSFLPYAKLLRAHGVEATLVADNRRYQVIKVAA